MQPQTITLKPYRESDQDRLIDLLTNASIRETYICPISPLLKTPRPCPRKLLAVSWSDEHYERGIYLDKSLIVLSTIGPSADGRSKSAYVIHPDHQNRGYAPGP